MVEQEERPPFFSRLPALLFSAFSTVSSFPRAKELEAQWEQCHHKLEAVSQMGEQFFKPEKQPP